MKAPTRGRWLGIALAAGLGLTSFTLGTNAEAAPSPGNKISGRGGNVGLGISHGDPFGISFKWFMHPKHALQSDLGWAPLHHSNGRFGADYLWHPGTFVSNATLDFLPYLGAGAGVLFWGDHYYGRGRGHGYYDRCYYDNNDIRRCPGAGAAFMLRAPILGLGIHWKKVPLDTMAEGSWSPYLGPFIDLGHGDFSIKVRYYF